VSKLVPLHHPDSCWDLRQLLLQGKKEDEDDGGESSSWLSASYVVYLVRPVPAWTRVIAAHVEQHARLTHAWPTSLAAASSTPAPNTLSYLVSSSEAPAGSTRFGIIFTPQSSVVCDRILEEEGVKGMVGVYEYGLDLLPYGDVLSMERDESFMSLFVENDTSLLFYIARSLLQLQRTYGAITNIKGRGVHAQAVANLFLKFTQEEAKSKSKRDLNEHRDDNSGEDNDDEDSSSDSEDSKKKKRRGRAGRSKKKASRNRSRSKGKEANNEAGKIDTLIILDRSLDLITPLVTPFTYEALLAEVLGINYGSTQADAGAVVSALSSSHKSNASSTRYDRREHDQRKWMSQTRAEEGARQGPGGGEGAGDTVRVSLYGGSGKLFDELRDVNLTLLQQKLEGKARRLTPKYLKLKGTLVQNEKEGSLLSEKELNRLLPKFAVLQSNYQALQIHTNLTDKVIRATQRPTFLACLRFEQRLIATGDVGRDPLLDQAIQAGEKIHVVLRLLSLYSTVNGGLQPPAYNRYRAMVLDRYGMQHTSTLHNLETAGLLTPPGGRPTYPKLRELLRLIVPEAQNGEASDIAYTCSGYAPLSIRLVEAAADDGWQNEELRRLRNVLGPVFEYTLNEAGELVNDDDDSQTKSKRRGTRSRSRESHKSSRNEPKVALVFIIGGMTYSEAAALRLLSSQGRTEYLAGTTNLISGDSFLHPFLE